MANQIIVLALVFFAAVAMASASTAAPSVAPTGHSLPPAAAIATSPLAPTSTANGFAEGPIGESSGSTIGTISGGTASDAAPVGGPVPDGAFADLTPTLAPPAVGAAVALQVTTIAGAIAAAAVGSLFF